AEQGANRLPVRRTPEQTGQLTLEAAETPPGAAQADARPPGMNRVQGRVEPLAESLLLGNTTVQIENADLHAFSSRDGILTRGESDTRRNGATGGGGRTGGPGKRGKR